MFGAYINLDYSKLDSEEYVSHFDLGAKATFGNSFSKFRPYAGLIYSGFALANDNADISMSGDGFGIDVGVMWFFTPRLAIDLGLKYNAFNLNTLKFLGNSADIDIDLNSTRVGLSLSYHF